MRLGGLRVGERDRDSACTFPLGADTMPALKGTELADFLNYVDDEATGSDQGDSGLPNRPTSPLPPSGGPPLTAS